MQYKEVHKVGLHVNKTKNERKYKNVLFKVGVSRYTTNNRIKFVIVVLRKFPAYLSEKEQARIG